MEIILAQEKDLNELNILIDNTRAYMDNNNIPIWNDFYPYCEFESDIKNNELYIVKQNGKIVSVFCLSEKFDCPTLFYWKEKKTKALYLSKLAVDSNNLKNGIGTQAVRFAEIYAKDNGYKYLRLTVAEVNEPAIKLYSKNGFKKVEGHSKNEYITKCNNTELAFEKEIF
jgi:ribosomal protein S18 acetylase RimI-like enzyme